jgi:hypothetical protein
MRTGVSTLVKGNRFSDVRCGSMQVGIDYRGNIVRVGDTVGWLGHRLRVQSISPPTENYRTLIGFHLDCDDEPSRAHLEDVERE